MRSLPSSAAAQEATPRETRHARPAPTPTGGLALPERRQLLSRPAWTALLALVLIVGFGAPIAALVLPASSAYICRPIR